MKRVSYDPESLKQEYLNPDKLNRFVFNVDLGNLEEGDRRAVPKLLKAIEIIDRIFLMQDHPQALAIRDQLLKDASRGSEGARVALQVFNMFNGPHGVNYDNQVVPLFSNVMPRPNGGTVYTDGITPQELEEYLSKHPEKADQFNKINTIIARSGKGFVAIPYEVRYRDMLEEASSLLNDASQDVASESFAKYLRSRAEALVSGNYFRSDVDFVNSTDSKLDLLIGPLESYQDMVQNKKAFYAGLLCMKNPEESARVSAYISHLQTLEDMLPQERRYSKEMSSTNIPVAVVDIIAMSGDFQAKRPTITVGETLPNDEKVLLEAGRKIFIYKNVLTGFEKNEEKLGRLLDPSLLQYATERGRVNSVVGHEVSHSLGPKETLISENGRHLSVNDALGFYNGIIEELKADLLSAYNLPYLVGKGIYSQDEAREVYLEECLLRNLPLNKPIPGKDTHYVGTLMKLNYFIADGSVTLTDGRFSIDFEKATQTVRKMVEEVLSIQSSGSKGRAELFIGRWSQWTEEADYASRVMQECKPKLYKEVVQPSSKDLLRE